MKEIPGFRYDHTIKNYVPILRDTPENRALNLCTTTHLIKNENDQSLKRQKKRSRVDVIRHRKLNYPLLQNKNLLINDVNKFQQIGIHNIKNITLVNNKTMKFSEAIYDHVLPNQYDRIFKSFQPDINSQIVLLSYAYSTYSMSHCLFDFSYPNILSSPDLSKPLIEPRFIDEFINLVGIKMSQDKKKIFILNHSEFSVLDRFTYETQVNLSFEQKLPVEQRYSFDAFDRFLIGKNVHKGVSKLISYDLNDSSCRYTSVKCDWDRKWVFRDIVFDCLGERVFFALRGRMNNSTECVLQHDLRCPIPSEKNIRRLSLNFTQSSSVSITRVPNYPDLIVTHCLDGRCALWDMRWKDRPAAVYKYLSPGKPYLPIDIDTNAQFVTMTDSDNVVRIFNLKTGLNLYSEKLDFPDNSPNYVYSFFSPSGLHCRPTLVSNISPRITQVQQLEF